jgi:hypothetical protein
MPMRRNLYATLSLAASLAGGALALNPIHDASYNLVPRGKFASRAVFSVAGAVDSRSDGAWSLPFSLNLEPVPRAELGAGLKTHWGDAGSHIPYLALGGKYLLSGATTLQGDVLLGIDRGAGKGFSLGLHHREGHGGRLFSRFTGRFGFMEALVRDDALMALEAAWYPTLSITRPLSLEMGLVASSQTENFDRYFAFDLKPALQVHMGRERMVESAVYLGLAGDNREDLRAQVAVIYGF